MPNKWEKTLTITKNCELIPVIYTILLLHQKRHLTYGQTGNETKFSQLNKKYFVGVEKRGITGE